MISTFRRISLRQLAAHKLRTALTVFGVALGVAAMIALRLLNESASRSFAEATERIAGRTALEIHNGEAGVPEELLEEIGSFVTDLT
jgi:putative ABC transport system permease protein